MKWSKQQLKVIDEVTGWLARQDRQIFRLFGYAGTGKTTLAKHFAKNISGNVLFAAYTGKAAHVMRGNGCENATTIHSLIYVPKGATKSNVKRLEAELLALPETTDPRIIKKLTWQLNEARKKANTPLFSLKETSPIQEAALIVIDECSMVDQRIGEDLCRYGVPILVLGDPAQLPPVGGGGYFTAKRPNFLLTEIHRQGANSPVIDLATQVREGRQLRVGEYQAEGHVSSHVLGKGALTPELALSVDQIIVGRNKTRHSVNKRVRDLMGHRGSDPVKGDKLVCLRNNHELGLLNGSLWTVVESFSDSGDMGTLSLESEDSRDTIVVDCWMQTFRGQDDNRHWAEKQDAESFDYGYALTCHKAQGSQFGKVLVIDESRDFKSHKDKWLYTAITRAAESVVIA